MRAYPDRVRTDHKIKEVAERSGFTAATLRYYEQIGLLPAPRRSAAGYRLYDDRTFERLKFIARAKQLGCSLDEIADLTIAWDGGRCGPVQDRLRSLVADKLDTAERQIVGLLTFTADLHQAAATLELHRPNGPCDDRCGCVTDTNTIGAAGAASDWTNPKVVSLSRKRAAPDDPPIVCTLGSQSMSGRLDDWAALLAHVTQREPIDDGVRCTFGPGTPLDELIRLTAAEQDCCQFFDFAITVDRRGIALEVRSPEAARPVVHALFGTTS